VIQSEPIKTVRTYRHKVFHENHEVHRWFRRLVTQVLLPIGREIALAKISVE